MSNHYYFCVVVGFGGGGRVAFIGSSGGGEITAFTGGSGGGRKRAFVVSAVCKDNMWTFPMFQWNEKIIKWSNIDYPTSIDKWPISNRFVALVATWSKA